ncbi:MAG: 50S ribosomal protein L14 [SAR324 cluster bacterium]|uniref:Large ribosomal subunit protein uL14 n=1 Tax=SAR324 cluster bacterium TaxID=2024889 RepID=A0A2A4SN46_9DELT|nr:MAG: 50S ribosomal protein L14 [SAR324 cluster bacterium]
MIQPQTILKVIDNSGGKTARCLKILKKGAQPRYAKIGDIIVVSIQQLRKRNRLTSKVRRGDVLRAVIVQTRSIFIRQYGLAFSFQQNAIVLLEKQGKPIATRVLGITPKELKIPKFSKIVSLSVGTI